MDDLASNYEKIKKIVRYEVLSQANYKGDIAAIHRQLKVVLSDLSAIYPDFTGWLAKVFNELSTTNRRKIILCKDGDSIIGVVILKDTKEEKKICTLRVLPRYQGSGIGTTLANMSCDILGERFPLITVSEDYISEYKPFLHAVGFKLKDKIKSLYRLGRYEYFFNKAYVHKVVLLSVQPKYADAMVEGRKTIEFRKRIFPDSIEKVYVYSSSPVKRIVGCFDRGRVHMDTPEQLWSKYSGCGCISQDDYETYYQGHSVAYAIEINNFCTFRHTINPKEIIPGFQAPQSYCYIDNVEALDKLEQLI